MQDLPFNTIVGTNDGPGEISEARSQLLNAEDEMTVGIKLQPQERSVAENGIQHSETRTEAVRIREAEEVKVAQITRLAAEARTAESAQIRKAVQMRADQVGRFHAAAASRAAEEAKIAAVAEIRAKTDEEARIQAENQARDLAQREAEEEAKAAREAEIRAMAEAQALAKAAEQAEEMPPPRNITQRLTVAAAAPLKIVTKSFKRSRRAKRSKRSKSSNKNVWFYSCEGERLGPVRFAQLRVMAADFSLNPRLDMIWREGMDTWKPAGQIDGLFERRNVKGAKQEAVIALSPPPQIRRSHSVLGKNASWPGARRPSLLFASVLFPFVWHYLLKGAVPYLTKEFGPMIMGQILPFARLVPVVLVIQLALRRLINLGMSRWWILAVLMPIVNFWLGYRCLVCPAGYAYHKKLDAAGIILAILYGSALMLAGLAIVAGVTLLFDPTNCPPQWLPLREVVRSAIQLFQ